jgi:hypothetical protein
MFGAGMFLEVEVAGVVEVARVVEVAGVVEVDGVDEVDAVLEEVDLVCGVWGLLPR